VSKRRSPFCELGLDQMPDQTPIPLFEREFIRKAGFQGRRTYEEH